MNSKIKKIMLLTTGLAGGLLATSIAGITLSSCTFQVQQDPNNNNNNNNQGNTGSTNQGTTTSPKDELTYNPNANYYTTQIIFDASGNITNASANTLTIKDGLIFADPAMTTLIGIMPSMQQSTITIPATVKAITGYQAAVVYDTQSGNIVNPTFSPTTGITIGSTQALLDLGSVGAFQHVGTIANGTTTQNTRVGVTPPSMSTPATGLSTLTTINFANNSQLQTIGPKAFAGCNNLTTVNLPNATNTIGAQAFQNCTNLQTINLKGVSYIGDAAFNNAFIAQNDALATANPVSLDLTSAQYIGTGAFDSSVWTSTPSGAGNQTPVQVLPGTTSTPGTNTVTEAQNLSKISSVSFSKPLTTLSPYAFNGANYLTAADLSSCTSLASVGNNAFSGTQNLTSVKFSNTIDTIGNNAFSGVNTKLTTLTLPANLATVGNDAFSGCSQLSTLTVDSTSLSIGDNAFSGCDLSALDFSKAVGGLIIGTSAFSNNENLKTLKLATENLEPDSQTQIKSQAFSGCKNLDLQAAAQAPGDTPPTDPTTTPITLPSNLTLLAQDAFSGTKNPTFSTKYTGSIQLASDSLISSDPFGGKWNLLNDNDYHGTIAPVNTLTLGPQLFANNQNITEIDLSGSNIQALGWTGVDQIQNSIGSTNFTIPGGNNTSNTLGTFANCTNLTTLTLPATCNQFGTSYNNYYWGGPFANCQSLANINYNGFDLTPVSTGDNAVTAGFNQINQATWTQVANIMNAFGYAGQQTINANGTVTNDPSAETGTWASSAGLGSKGGENNIKSYQGGMNGWYADSGSDNSWVNQPINVYPAGSYSYYTTAASDQNRVIAQDSKKTVSYASGLGYSTAATTGVSSGSATLSTVQDQSYLSISSSQLNDNTTIQVLPSTGAADTETITISGTRPMSVWYTVGAQEPTNPTDNIYVPTENKLVGTSTAGSGGNNNGVGGIGWTSTAVGQEVNKKGNGTESISGAGTPFKLEGYSSSPIEGQPNTQNFYALPLGITADTTVAYFNHNGVIWQYKKNDDGSITITGTVNYYVAGAIVNQKNGFPPHTLTSQTFNNNGTGLTTVGNIGPGGKGGPSNSGFYGLDGTSNYSYGSANAGLLLFSKKGQNTNGTEAPISATVGPKGLTVTLTLVPASTNNSSSQN